VPNWEYSYDLERPVQRGTIMANVVPVPMHSQSPVPAYSDDGNAMMRSARSEGVMRREVPYSGEEELLNAVEIW